jgi:signal peptidase I
MRVQVVVVLSGSMEPGFQRGDILFLNMGKAPIRTGEIVVFNIDGREIPIVHRVIKVHERTEAGHIDVLTKVCVLLLVRGGVWEWGRAQAAAGAAGTIC